MSELEKKIIKAWKDPEYRKTLSEEELASIPDNPAGDMTLISAEGGGKSYPRWTCNTADGYC